MKKYGILGAVAAVVVAAVAGWFIFRGSNDSMASSLPKDVTMVARIDLKGLVLDYGLSLKEAKELLFSKKDTKETGLDLFTPAYVFSSKGYLGVIIAVSDADKLETYLKINENIGNIEEQRGLKWCVLDGNVLMGFSDDRIMIVGPAVGYEQEELRNMVATCLEQKASESGKQSRLYKLMDKRSEPVSLALNSSLVPEDFLLREVPWLLKKMNLSAIDLVAGLTVKKEKIDMGVTLNTEDKNVEKIWENIDDVLQPIDGDLLESTPQNALIHLALGMDGEDMLELLREDQTVRTALLMINALFDFDMMLKNIDGDVSLAMFPPTSVGDVAHDFLFQAELDDDKFMKNIMSWNDDVAHDVGVSFYAKDAHHGICKVGNDLELFFATPKGKRLAISNSEARVEKQEARSEKWETGVKGNRIFFAINPKELNQSGFWGVDVPMLNLFDSFTVGMPRVSEMKIEMTFSEGVDLLKELNLTD